jgi:hypothetical protein
MAVAGGGAGAAEPATSSSLQTDAPASTLPEGLAWDPTRGRFLLSSIRDQRILTVDPRNGHSAVFAKTRGSLLGMHPDPDGKRLWAAYTRFSANNEINDGTGLMLYDLAGGTLLGDWPLPNAAGSSVLGDLLVLGDGSLITTDSVAGGVYRFDPKPHRYTTLVPPGNLKSPQGIAPGIQAGTVVFADYATGLWELSLATRSRRLLAAPEGVELRGIDGLYRVGASLVAVQNGTQTPRVLWIRLVEAGVGQVTPLAEGRAGWDGPALGVVRGNEFWLVANGQWDRFGPHFELPTAFALKRPLLDRVLLPKPEGALSRP